MLSRDYLTRYGVFGTVVLRIDGRTNRMTMKHEGSTPTARIGATAPRFSADRARNTRAALMIAGACSARRKSSRHARTVIVTLKPPTTDGPMSVAAALEAAVAGVAITTAARVNDVSVWVVLLGVVLAAAAIGATERALRAAVAYVRRAV